MSIVKINTKTSAKATEKKVNTFGKDYFSLTLPLEYEGMNKEMKDILMHEVTHNCADAFIPLLEINVYCDGTKEFSLIIEEHYDGDTLFDIDSSTIELTPEEENFYFCKAIEQLGEDLKALAELEGMEE